MANETSYVTQKYNLGTCKDTALPGSTKNIHSKFGTERIRQLVRVSSLSLALTRLPYSTLCH